MLATILIFIAVLGLLVFVHELGHFLVAKKSGMDVHEFGFGFPPRLIGFYRKDGKWRVAGPTAVESNSTIYSINWIMLGGFVKIAGENNDEAENPNSFSKKKFFPRLATLAAGVFMNFVLAWLLLSVGFAIGMPQAYFESTDLPASARVVKQQAVIAEVASDSPASFANFQVGDVVVSANGEEIASVEQLRSFVVSHGDQEVRFVVERGGTPLELVATPRAVAPENQGPLGVSLATLGLVRVPWYLAPWEGLKGFAGQFRSVGGGLYGLFSGQQSLENLGGPARIAKLTGDVASMGVPYLLQFTAFLSVNLGLLNVLPIPALDGGRIVFLVVEKIRRKPNNQMFEQWVNATGFFALLALMLFVTWNDLQSFGGITSVFKKIF